MIKESAYKLIKMHGTGNDFLIMNLHSLEVLRQFEKRVPKQHRPDWVRRVCKRHFGVGADGLLFVEAHDSLDFQWDFYNSDGSSAEMCGNAARCVARFAFDEKIADSEMTFLSIAGPITARVSDDGQVEIETGTMKVDPEESLEWDGKSWTFQRINSGVPHSIIVVNDDKPLTTDARKYLAAHLRSHSSHGEGGSNVTFYRPLGDNKIESVSFERGVEDFTLACGTGVLAAGFHFCQSKGIAGCEVQVPGGLLKVSFPKGEAPKLSGPAQYVAEVHPNLELF